MAAKNKQPRKERKCRKNIATLLSLMGFHDDDPVATINTMRAKLKQIQEKAKFKKPVRKLILKWGGKTATIPLKPKPLPSKSLTVSCNVDHDMQITYSRNINNAACSENNPCGSCSCNKENMMMINNNNNNVDHHHHQVSDQSLKEKGHDNRNSKNSNVCSENNPRFDQMMIHVNDFIKSIGGSKAKLVMVKELTTTDVNKCQNRLLIPSANVENAGFLSSDEKRKLANKQDISVQVFDPERCEWTLNLARWNMNKEVYVLKTSWYDIVNANGLEKKTMIQVWSFRVNEQQLCFALVRV